MTEVHVVPRKHADRMHRWEVWLHRTIVNPYGPGGKTTMMSGGREIVAAYPFKFLAVRDAVGRGRALKAELFIHDREGKIQDRRSYGNDPKGRG